MSEASAQPIDWATPLARYRAGPAGPGGDAGLQSAHADLVACGLLLLQRQFRKFLEILGTQLAQDTVRRKMLLPDGRGKTLADYLADPTTAQPAAFAYTALSRALCDAARKVKRERDRSVTAAENASRLAEAAGDVSVAVAADPRLIASQVCAVLELVANGLPVALQLLGSQRLPVDHPLAKGQDRLRLRRFAAEIIELSAYLRRDIDLGPLRNRWQHGGYAARDAWARAWQARLYTVDNLPDFTSHGEIPDSAALSRAAFDQHNRRFRQRWQISVGEGVPAVKRHGDRPTALVARRLAIPHHQTLGPLPEDPEDP